MFWYTRNNSSIKEKINKVDVTLSDNRTENKCMYCIYSTAEVPKIDLAECQKIRLFTCCSISYGVKLDFGILLRKTKYFFVIIIHYCNCYDNYHHCYCYRYYSHHYYYCCYYHCRLPVYYYYLSS